MPEHPHMILTLSECEKLSSLPNKVTAIIATCQAPLKFLAWSVFSLLLRSDKNTLDHICISINGADERTADTKLQDKKQKFLEDLRDLPWGDRDMPLTIIRAWSRIGHTPAMEMAIPWVHTEHYVIMHDDTIILDKDWASKAKDHFTNENVVATAAPPLMMALGEITQHQNANKVGLPHMHTPFILCRKDKMTKMGSRWWGYHIPIDFDFDNWKHKEKFIKYHTRMKHFNKGMPEGQFKFINMDIGGWLYYKANQRGLKFRTFDDGMFCHFKAGSWDANIEKRLHKFQVPIESIEKEIMNHPLFSKVYRKHVWNSTS